MVDLDAFDANADDLVRRAGGKPVRVASKSLRVPALIARALAHDGFAGVLAYTVAEALWLHETGISDDIVVAYPQRRRRGAAPPDGVAGGGRSDHPDGRRLGPPRRGGRGPRLARRRRSGSRSTSTPA